MWKRWTKVKKSVLNVFKRRSSPGGSSIPRATFAEVLRRDGCAGLGNLARVGVNVAENLEVVGIFAVVLNAAIDVADQVKANSDAFGDLHERLIQVKEIFLSPGGLVELATADKSRHPILRNVCDRFVKLLRKIGAALDKFIEGGTMSSLLRGRKVADKFSELHQKLVNATSDFSIALQNKSARRQEKMYRVIHDVRSTLNVFMKRHAMIRRRPKRASVKRVKRVILPAPRARGGIPRQVAPVSVAMPPVPPVAPATGAPAPPVHEDIPQLRTTSAEVVVHAGVGGAVTAAVATASGVAVTYSVITVAIGGAAPIVTTATALAIVPLCGMGLVAVAIGALSWFGWSWFCKWRLQKEYSALCVELGLSESGLTPRLIERAYRQMGLRHHPDRHGGNCTTFVALSDKFERLVKLYEQLGKGQAGAVQKLYNVVVTALTSARRNLCVPFNHWNHWLRDAAI